MVAAPSTPPAINSNAPLAVPNSSVPTTSSMTENTAPTVTIHDYVGLRTEWPKKLHLTTGIDRQNLEVGNSFSKSKPLLLRNIPEPLWCGSGKQIARVIYDFFKMSGDNEAILDFRDLPKVQLKNDNVPRTSAWTLHKNVYNVPGSYSEN